MVENVVQFFDDNSEPMMIEKDLRNEAGENGTENRPFCGRSYVGLDNMVLIVRGFNKKGPKSESAAEKSDHEHINLNCNNNNSLTGVMLDSSQKNEIQKSSSTFPRFLALFEKLSDEVVTADSANNKPEDIIAVKDADRIFILHSLEQGGDGSAKMFLEKSLKSPDTCLQETSNSNFASKCSVLMCLPCGLIFSLGPSFAGHVVNCHGLDLSDCEIEVLERSHVDAILQKSDDKCSLWIMESVETMDQINKFGSSKPAIVEVISERLEDRKCSNCDTAALSDNNTRITEVSRLGKEIGIKKALDIYSSDKKSLVGAAVDSKPDDYEIQKSKITLLNSSDLNGNESKRSLLKAGRPPQSTSCDSPSLIAKQRMLDCQTMSFAIASPLDAHAQSPSSRPMLLNNALHNDVTAFESKSKECEMARFLSQRKSESEQTSEDRTMLVSTSQISSPLCGTKSSASVEPSVNGSVPPTILSPQQGSNQQNTDSLLNSGNVDPMFPMSLFQSRNSCKTLKCPKCNWHYKYRQTLEAHMKEKHFEETSDCVYCKAGQPHPRLSRGETYSCGYKPFKCNVCNYSTTTKGNLSIHMQSDKHLYNARNLQQRQQDRLRQSVTSSSYTPPSSQSSETTLASDNSVKWSSSPNPSKLPEYSEATAEKQVQGKRRRSSNKTNSSMDSGIFSSVSKVESPNSTAVRKDSSSNGKWRCDVCCYETTIARNLRIHMTSEKHAQNLALSERGLLNHLRQDEDNRSRAADGNIPAEMAQQMSAPNLMEYYAAAFKSLQGGGNDIAGKGSVDAEMRKAHAQYLQHQLFLAQQQQFLLAQQYQQLMMAAAASSLQQRLSQSSEDGAAVNPLALQKQQELMLQNQIWKQLMPSAGIDAGQTSTPDITTPAPQNEEASTIFSCGLCCVFGTDDITNLEAHVRKPRHSEGLNDPNNNEWVVKSRQREKENYFCKLCSYSTSLKTNFNLHCKTEKHTCKLNLISHVREGGSATSWMIPHIIRGSLSQSVSCNTCQFVTHSFEKLKLHCATEQHQATLNVCQYLQTLKQTQETEQETETRFRCTICNDFSTKRVIEMVKHMQASEHRLQLQSKTGTTRTTVQDMVAIERTDSSNSASKKGKQIEKEENGDANTKNLQCDFCNYSCEDYFRMQMHVMTQHNENSPLSCPLCQELLKNPLQLRLHLMQTHQLQLPPDSPKADSALSTEIKQDKSWSHTDNEEKYPEQHSLRKEESVDYENAANGDSSIDEDTSEIGSKQKEISAENVGKEESVQQKADSGRKPRTIDPNSLIIQVLKENSTLGEKAAQDDTRGADSAFCHIMTANSVYRSCPDLVSFAQDFNPVSSSTDSGKRKRIRMRSYPVDDGIESKTYKKLLRKYGLEQARHYVENRSSVNVSRARMFRRKNSEQKWSASFSDPEVTEKAEINSEIDRRIRKRKFSKGAKISNQQDEESLSCQLCGKEFSHVFILKAHEELAHGVFVSVKNIEKAANVYSDQIKGELKNSQSQDGEKMEKSAAKNIQESSNTPTTSPLEQQQNHQALLQALLKMQSLKQAGLPDNDAVRSSLLDFGAGSGEPGSMSSQLLSQMGLYSALLQSHALGMHPYQQMLNNVAALQQMQHLSAPALLGMTDGAVGRSSNSVFSGNLPGSVGMSSFENQPHSLAFDSLPKQDSTNSVDSAPGLGQVVHGQSPSLEVPAKRPRTRITDDQLKVLRANFDINNSPSEDQIDEMARRTSLPPKVIKHWFRNTLFKERQRSKDSPYNFNIPPVLSLEDAQKTNSKQEQAKTVQSGSQEETFSIRAGEDHSSSKISNNLLHKSSLDAPRSFNDNEQDKIMTVSPSTDPGSVIPKTMSLVSNIPSKEQMNKASNVMSRDGCDSQSMVALANMSLSKQIFNSTMGWPGAVAGYDANNDNLMYDAHAGVENSNFSGMPGSLCRRTPRTRFTDFQLQVLQDFFDRNAYPKDDDLDKLSQTLSLSTRVIVVWFQNARQKARKSFELQQHQHQQFSQRSPSGIEPGRSSHKIDERVFAQSMSRGVEDLAQKTLTEVSKKITDKPDLAEKQHSENGSEKTSRTDVSASCQICDKHFTSVEEWQEHQQDHFKANLASVFEQYGRMYAKGVMGKQSVGEKTELDNNLGKNRTSDQLTTQPSPLLGLGSLQAPKPNIPLDSSMSALSKMMADQSGHMGQMQTASSSLVGAAKRKASSSPTLTNYSVPTSQSATLANVPTFTSKMSSFPDEKEGVMQKDPKRLRTTITPEQLEYLYQQYLFDSSPSRKVIEQISEVVGLKKRVVQVWFQNTRARERKGQFRSSISRCVTSQMAQNKLCHVCRMVFRSKEELDQHIQTKHTGQQDASYAEEPLDKKIKLSGSPELKSDAILNKDKFLSATVNHMEQSKPKLNLPNQSASANLLLQNIKKESSANGGPLPSVSIEDSILKLAPKSLDGNQLSQMFTANHVQFSGIDIQSKLATLYSAAVQAADNFQPDGAANSPKRTPAPASDRTNPVPHSTADQLSPESQNSISRPSNLNDKEVTKSRDALQPVTKQSGLPSMVASSSLLDLGCTPTKRHRTQMSSAQVRALKHCYKAFKTPSLIECELIGNEIGLLKRVVQVWFQNARAKEKKQKLRQSVTGMDVGDIFEKEELSDQCEICGPIYHGVSVQKIRDHYFSKEHLQKLMRAMESERRSEGSTGFNTSLASPCSSYDSSETFLSENLGYESPTNGASPTMKGNHDNPTSPHADASNDSRMFSNQLTQEKSSNEQASAFGSDRKRSESDYNLQSDNSDSQFFAANPSLLQHYQKAVQQLINQQANQEQNTGPVKADSSSAAGQQAFFQRALQKSLYEILKLPQTSAAESQ